ncbi:MAG: hypothetical protein CMC82_05950 [Flavobacteriaceae bacterium]|nr:hypothetical protein [Flavobacteriaceae bacterium]
MEGKKQLITSEAFDAYERVRPILEEYFDNWMLMAHRVDCGTKVVLGDISKKSTDMKKVHSYAKSWKEIPLGDTK